ncbi:MAG: GldG family protein [Firmicutes bacterium]|nr:GldG family protein [Bacillota bacterium]
MKNKSKSLRLGGYSVVATVMVLAIAVIVNVLAAALPAKYTAFDTTGKNMYSLSTTTLELLDSLDQDITFTWLVKEGSEDTGIDLLLKEYQSNSSHIKVEKADPDLNPTLIADNTSQFYENSLLATCGERTKWVDFYDIYVIQYDAETYMYTQEYTVDFAGENAITGAINYVINVEFPKLYALTGHGETEITTNIKAAVKQANVDMENFSFFNNDEVPADADMLFVNGPTSDITDAELTKLSAYLKNGGNMLLITGPQTDGKVLPNLNKLMAYYGVQAVDGIVIEADTARFASNAPYMLLPELVSNEITIALKNTNSFVLMPFAHGITVGTAESDSVIVNKTLKTSNKAYSKLAGYNMQTYEKEDGDIDGGFALGVSITDTIDEAKDIKSKIIWFSSNYVIDEETSKAVAGSNQTMFMKAISWLCSSQDTGITIGAKSLAEETLNMSSSTTNILMVLFVILIPVLYLGAGIGVWLKRRHR